MSVALWLMTAFFTVVMGSILCVGYMVLIHLDRRKQKAGGSAPHVVPLDEVPLSSSQAVLAKTLQAVGESVPAKKDTESLRQRLAMAGYRWPTAVTIFHGIRVAVCLGLAGIVGWVILFMHGDSKNALIPALCAAGFGYLLPDRVLDRRVRARGRAIRSGLPSALDLVVLAVEAGQSLDQAMHDVALALSEVYPELSEEFFFYHLEVQAGKNREEALIHLGDRSPDAELKKVVKVFLDGDRYGTSLGPALRTHARYLRTRIRQAAQERARKLSVKLTMPTFFLIFPAVLVVTLGPAYLQLKDSLSRLLGGW